MEVQGTVCLRLENGNSPTWRRRIRGEESQSDSQVSAEHFGVYWSATLWHAGTAMRSERSCAVPVFKHRHIHGFSV